MSADADTHDDHDGHVLPLKLYYGVFGALIFFTVLTVLVSELDLGPLSITVAMVVALIKAALVVGYFMHLKFDTRFYSFVFFGSLAFLSLFFALTFMDLEGRAIVDPTQDTFEKRRDLDFESAAGRLDAATKEALARQQAAAAKAEMLRKNAAAASRLAAEAQPASSATAPGVQPATPTRSAAPQPVESKAAAPATGRH